MNASSVLAEVREIHAFMDRQQRNGHDTAQIANAQADVFASKIKKLVVLQADDANKLVDAFEAAPFGDDQKVAFANIIANKLVGRAGGGGAGGSSNGANQKIKVEHSG